MNASEFTTSVAGPGFAYRPGQVVGPGTKYGPREVPREQYEAWLACGYLTPFVLPGDLPKLEKAIAGHRR